MTFPIISADSHITEAPNTYVDYIDAKWRDKAPHIVDAGERGDLYVIDGMKSTISMGLVAAAGKKPEELALKGTRFDDLHRGGWDPEARMADQDTDGVSAEVIYPTVGMVVTTILILSTRKPASMPTIAGSPSTAAPIRIDCLAAGKPRCARRKKGSLTCMPSRRRGCAA